MAKVHAYLNFNGNCSDAFDFYETVFQTKNNGTYRFGGMPPEPGVPELSPEDQNKIMHISLDINENTKLMGSDCLEQFGQKAVAGNNNYIMLDTATAAEAKELFDRLSVNAQNMEMELGPQFYAEEFASFVDQFGIPWMIHFEGNRAQH